tara:strand:+ start:1624 stop:2940 length:1317 start_codon:yes stop_codon:yes gene_type:complete
MASRRNNDNSMAISLGAISFTVVLLLLPVINILIINHMGSYQTYTNPCDAVRRFDGGNPDDNNNICITTPEQLGFKKSSELITNGLLGDTVNIATPPTVANNMTQLEIISPAWGSYSNNDKIVSLCRHNDDLKTCKQVDSCKKDFDGSVVEDDSKEHVFVDDNIHGEDDAKCTNHKIPDICLFTGFENKDKNKVGLVYTTQVLGTWGLFFAIAAASLSTLHIFANLLARPCGGYCACFGNCCEGLEGFPCCASKYFVDTECPCTNRPTENVGLGARKYDSCSQCGVLTFLTLWTVAGFLAFTMPSEDTIRDQCYGVKNSVLYGDKTAQEFIEELGESIPARKNLVERQTSYTVIYVLLIVHAIFYLIGTLIYGCAVKKDSYDTHDLVQGFSNGLFGCCACNKKDIEDETVMGLTEKKKGPQGVQYQRVPLRGTGFQGV